MAKPQAKAQKADEYRIDSTIPRVDPNTGMPHVYWRVYYWAERPDAAARGVDDKNHWHPDSEHATQEAAQKRMAELRAGAPRQSIMDMSGLNIQKH